MTSRPYASRAGQKLEAALRAFALDATGRVCVDLGSHAGGFVDCLLRHGAARVYAVEPGYGVLDYRLRRDPRVIVVERQNALQFQSPEPADLVTIDVGWTPQRIILPAARRNLRPNAAPLLLADAARAPARVITLVKPQYEAPPEWLRHGVLAAERIAETLALVRRDVGEAGWLVLAELESPLRGTGGNVEFLWLLARR